MPPYVTRLDDRTGAEPADDLSEPADVVDDRRHSGPEHLEKRSGDVDLGAVGEERDRRLGKRAPDLAVGEEAEAPLCAVSRRELQPVQRHAWIARHEKARTVDPEDSLDGVLGALVRADEAEGERGAAVVAPVDVRAKRGVGDDAEVLVRHAERRQRVASPLRVDDDPITAREERPPEARSGRCPARDDVVGREDDRRARSKEPAVGLGRAEPLQVQHVRLVRRELDHPEGVLQRFHREPGAGRAHSRRERIEPLARGVPLRPRDRAEPKARRHELHIRAGKRERFRERAVVRRRVRRGIGEQDAHRASNSRFSRVTFEQARAQFPVLERVAYLQAGSAGPLAGRTTEAMAAEEERNLREGRVGLEYIERVLALRAELRAELAGLVGVEAEQVALTASTTDGCNLVLAGLDLDPGDEVITTTDEHFGLIGPLHASGARVVVVPPDADAIAAAVTPRTRLLAVSHVLWTTGQVLPVRELRERTGIPILVDGAQSVGAIPVDAAGLDFLTISGQKWLCGPESTGGLVVADPERLRVARPSYFSQQGYEPDGAFEPWPGARRFDPNWVPTALMSGLLAAVRLRPEWRFERGAAMAERCRELLVGAGEDVVSPDERATHRLLASARRGVGRRGGAAGGRRGHRSRHPENRARARIGRLVDERRRSRATPGRAQGLGSRSMCFDVRLVAADSGHLRCGGHPPRARARSL